MRFSALPRMSSAAFKPSTLRASIEDCLYPEHGRLSQAAAIITSDLFPSGTPDRPDAPEVLIARQRRSICIARLPNMRLAPWWDRCPRLFADLGRSLRDILTLIQPPKRRKQIMPKGKGSNACARFRLPLRHKISRLCRRP